jgi:tetratricopeptide (TPR) repeat protein
MRRWIFPLLLILACLGVYSQTWHFQFVHFDDQDYVYANPQVLRGLHWQTICWAFTTGQLANYHPLTWLSLEADVSLWGVAPGWFHLENVLFHIANSLLLLRLIRRLTRDLPIAVFTAFVFALHPTHVESVAWVSERKDVLSTFFLLLALLSWVTYATSNSTPAYLRCVIFTAISFLAKQMGVTLPIVLLLLDYWPLQRWKLGWRQLAGEKTPLLILSGVASCAILIAQQAGGAVATLHKLSISSRLQSIPIAYLVYLRQMFWPSDLCAFYPYQTQHSIFAVAGSILFLFVTSAICWRQRHRRPYLLVGWLWFTVMLVPVIGLVQVGGALTADRYLYLPSVGLTLMVAELARDLLNHRQSRLPRHLASIAAGGVLFALAMLSYTQAGYWRDTRSLFTHALQLINQGSDVHMQLARFYASENDKAGALREYLAAARLDPNDFEPEYDLGNLCLDDPPQAIAHYQRALQLRPGNALIENNLAIAYFRAGRKADAIAAFRSAAKDDPSYIDAPLNLAKLLESEQLPQEARLQYQAVLRLDPANSTALAGLRRLGNRTQAYPTE